MAIEKKDVEYVANLARLDVSEAEKQKYAGQLGSILTYVEKLNELNTDGVEPTSHVVPMRNAFRKDEQKPSMHRDELMKNAPERDQDHFAIPKVIP